MKWREDWENFKIVQKTKTIQRIISLGETEQGEGARPLRQDKKEGTTGGEETAFL